MKILMIAPQPFFQPRGTPFSVLGRLRALSHLGHEVDLVTYHIGENVDLPGLTIYRTPSVPFVRHIAIGPSIIKLLLDVLLLGKTWSLLLKKQYDMIHSHEEASFFGIVLARWFRLPHLYDMHSSLPQQLKNFDYTTFAPLIRLFEWLENRAIGSSRAVITICPALEAWVKHKFPTIPEIMIENVVLEGNPDEVTDGEVEEFRTRYDVQGKPLILYSGTFEPYQGLDVLIAGADRVLEQIPNAVFVLMGGKSEQIARYQDQVERMGCRSSFRFTGMRPPREVTVAIRCADVLVSPRISGTNTPLKIYAYLQSGKPIVATNLFTHTQVLNADVAMLVEPKPEAFADALIAILKDPELGQALGRRARHLFESRFSFSQYLRKTEEALQLMETPPRPLSG